MRFWPFFGRKPEARDVQFSPALSVWLANAGRTNIAAAGISVTPDTAMRMMAVFACVRVIAEDIASLPLMFYQRLEPRGKERAVNHPLYTLLHDQPNPEMTSLQFRETLTTHLLLWGNGFAEIVRGSNGYPVQLWPIPPSRVSMRRRTDTSPLEYDIQPVSGNRLRLSAKQILHIRGLSLNGVWGLSPIGMAREAIGLGLASEEFASGFFANGARPPIYFTHPGQLSEEAHKRLRADMEATLTGLSNAQRVALLEEGMTAKESMMPLNDAQFIENRKFAVEEVARLYRVQPFKIGHHERSTFNNIEHLGIDHVVSTIRPWAVRWEQAIWKDLIPAEEQGEFFAEFAIHGLLRGDHAARSEFYKTMWGIGALSPNDIRDLEGQNPVEGGDEYYVPTDYIPVSMAAVPPGAGAELATTQGQQQMPPSANGHKETVNATA